MASFADQTKGRDIPIEKCPLRTEYMRDRDRILHSKSFRRLKHKTQVFYSPEGDHYRTRLTHTLEVAQISRTIARCLRLNEDLTEAAALGHDLGHTPFGHAGERALRELTDGRFCHNEQSLRVVEKLENNGKGLNLTWEVRDGIVNHTGNGVAGTPEGRIIKFADRIAYINHDIDDALRAGIIRQEDLPIECVRKLGQTHSERINTMICDIVSTSCTANDIMMSQEIYSSMMELRAFMFEKVYIDSAAKQEEGKAEEILKSLYAYYMADPKRLPEEPYRACALYGEQTAVCDYLAGMTDRYAVNRFVTLFIPKSWQSDAFSK
ncbi:MAG: deoxyguanosinetriphosphate triphosphohydrolase [Eubacteriales bacterium]|nr:deoxyguanosinetriphosphate triphosphohydrolase [Eubacteriales bacterium]